MIVHVKMHACDCERVDCGCDDGAQCGVKYKCSVCAVCIAESCTLYHVYDGCVTGCV